MKSSKQLIVALVLGFGIGLVSASAFAGPQTSIGNLGTKALEGCKGCRWTCGKRGVAECTNTSCKCNAPPGATGGGAGAPEIGIPASEVRR